MCRLLHPSCRLRQLPTLASGTCHAASSACTCRKGSSRARARVTVPPEPLSRSSSRRPGSLLPASSSCARRVPSAPMCSADPCWCSLGCCNAGADPSALPLLRPSTAAHAAGPAMLRSAALSQGAAAALLPGVLAAAGKRPAAAAGSSASGRPPAAAMSRCAADSVGDQPPELVARLCDLLCEDLHSRTACL